MNARKKIYLLLSLILICSMILISCKAPTGNIIVPEEDDGVVNIGLSIDSFVIERWQRERDLFVSKAEELGAVVNVQNANGDIETQIKQIEYFIEKKVDVIVIISIDDNELVDVVSRAKKEGIRVIAYDRIIRNANVDLYISVDNIQVGKLMGMYIKDAIGNDGSIIQIKGSPTDYNVDMVQEGFESIINTTNITIDYAEFSDGWMAENGFDTTSEYLSTGKVPDAIMCGNDDIATYEYTDKATGETKTKHKVKKHYSPVQVDVFDVNEDRTCGILVEQTTADVVHADAQAGNILFHKILSR